MCEPDAPWPSLRHAWMSPGSRVVTSELGGSSTGSTDGGSGISASSSTSQRRETYLSDPPLANTSRAAGSVQCCPLPTQGNTQYAQLFHPLSPSFAKVPHRKRKMCEVNAEFLYRYDMASPCRSDVVLWWLAPFDSMTAPPAVGQLHSRAGRRSARDHPQRMAAAAIQTISHQRPHTVSMQSSEGPLSVARWYGAPGSPWQPRRHPPQPSPSEHTSWFVLL